MGGSRSPAAATLSSCAVRFGWWVFPPGENITAQLRGSVRLVGVFLGRESNRADARFGSVPMMGVSPGETDNMDLCV